MQKPQWEKIRSRMIGNTYYLFDEKDITINAVRK
jgi:hypothetical protein